MRGARGESAINPPLRLPMQAAIHAPGFGRYEKIALRFETAFWRQDGISHLMVYSSDPEEPTLWVFDLDAFGAGPVLCAHLVHTMTPYALDRTSAQAVTWFADVLAEVVGHRLPEPEAQGTRAGFREFVRTVSQHIVVASKIGRGVGTVNARSHRWLAI